MKDIKKELKFSVPGGINSFRNTTCLFHAMLICFLSSLFMIHFIFTHFTIDCFCFVLFLHKGNIQ